MGKDSDIIQVLSEIIKKRKAASPDESYVANLFNKGKVKIANKLGEEVAETISAFLAEGKKEILEESADLIFHLLVLLEYSGISPDEVFKVLKKRQKKNG